MARKRFVERSQAASTWQRFRPMGRRAAVHATLRVVTLPLERLLSLIPQDGSVLEIGCGHGVVCFALADRVQGGAVAGVDVDAHKIAIAQGGVRRESNTHPPKFALVDTAWGQLTGEYDVVVTVDVLYLLGHTRALAAIDRLTGLVPPGGTLVLKEMSRFPRWKTWIDRLQETVAVRLLRITAGTRVAPLSVEEAAGRLESLGWCTTIHRLDRGYPHPHAAVVAQLRVAPSPG